MSRFLTVLALLLCLVAPSVRAEDSLYKRLGGYDAICAVTDDFLGRLLSDHDLARFFVGASADTQKRIRQHIVDFLVEKTGGPAVYTGRTMKESHHGLKISEAEWNKTAGYLGDTLKKFKVPPRETDEVFKLVGTLKADIVEN